MSWGREFENYDEEIASSGGLIYVSSNGSDTRGNGSMMNPFATLAKAKSILSASRKIIAMRGGSYNESFVWPNLTGVKVACIDGNGLAIIRGAAGGSNVVSVNPAASSGTWEMTLKGVVLKHRTGQVGLQVDNAYVTKRINLYLENIGTDQEGTGNSIDVDRSGPNTDAIRLYANGNGEVIEGLVHYITELTDDRVRFKGYRLVGGLTVAGAIACEVALISCGMKTTGFSPDGANKLTNVHCWYETDANPNIYTLFTDAYATA
jgi:hypothetical protein